MQAQSFAIMAQEQLQQGAWGLCPHCPVVYQNLWGEEGWPCWSLNQETEVPLQAEMEGQPWFIAVHCPARQELKPLQPTPLGHSRDTWEPPCHFQTSHETA